MSYPDTPLLSAVGRDNTDEQMRAAYERWRTAFYEQNVETTPAYDVVGLLAALCLSSRRSAKTYFDIGSLGSNKNVLQEGAQVYKLLAKYRTKDALASIFSDLEGFRSSIFKLLIITDFGEETDDEVTCLLANKLHAMGLVDVRFLFTTAEDRFEAQIERFKYWGGNPDLVCSIYAKNTVVDWLNEQPGEEEKEVESAKPVILQIGPVHEPTNAAGWRTIWRPNVVAAYDYVVVGTLNGVPALNVKADARDSALHLMSGAETKIVVDTMAGLGAFNFCAESLSSLFGAVDPSRDESRVSIQEHVCRIGWRNSVGRASPFAARFVAHLVSEPVGAFGGGANYMTARKIQEDLGGEVVSNARSRAIAEKYLEQLQNRPGPPNFNFMKLTIADDGSTNNPNGATAQSIVNGYAYILDCLNTFFGVPIEFFESGQPEKWNPAWETPSNFLPANERAAFFTITDSMRVPSLSASESAFTTGIPAGSGLIGIGRYTQGLALQMRSKHPPNTMLLHGHYKLLNSGDKLDELMSKHLNISSELLRDMQQKLCTSKSRKVSSVVAAIHRELGTDKSKELLQRHLFGTDQWQLI